MVAERVYRVAYVETDRSQDEVKDVFSQCGEIRGIYPWNVDDRRRSVHFFVEFDQQGSVKRARALKLPTDKFKVHVLAFKQHYIPHFYAVASYSYNKRFGTNLRAKGSSERGSPAYKQTYSKNTGSGRKPHVKSANKTPRASASFRNSSPASPESWTHDKHGEFEPGSSTMGIGNKENWVSPWRTDNHMPYTPISTASTSGSFDALTRPSSIGHTPIPGHRHQYQEPDLFSPSYHATTNNEAGTSSSSSTSTIKAEPAPNDDIALSNSTPFPSNVPTSLANLENSTTLAGTFGYPEPLPVPAAITVPSIVLSYEGDPFVFELGALTDDPENVLFMLRQTARSFADRDKWMVVAAHYRRQGNAEAAISVLSAMVEVFTSPPVNVSSDSLKPVYLMLSGCHTDMKRQLKKVGGEENVESARQHMEQAQDYLRRVYGPLTPFNASTSAASISSQTKAQPAGRNNSESSADVAQRLRLLEREVQSLRDRHTNHLSYLDQARSAKRKLEDSVSHERMLRKKAEEEVHHLEGELRGARRAEQSALDQCRREVANRRKMEENVAEVRDLNKEVKALRDDVVEGERKIREYEERETRRRETCAKMGTMLLRAAKGDFEDPGACPQAIPINTAATGPVVSAFPPITSNWSSLSGNLDMAPPGLNIVRERTTSASDRGPTGRSHVNWPGL